MNLLKYKFYRLLYFTSYLALIPILYYIIFETKSNIKNLLIILIFINFLLSINFWCNPIKNSRNHKLDSIYTKLLMIIIIIYIYCNLSNHIYLFNLLLLTLIFFLYLSDRYSRLEWCSKMHIIMHSFTHIIEMIGLFFIFI
jgi:hypothetical protein